MASSLSNLVNNLSEGIDEIKWKYGHNDKKCETCGTTYEVCNCFLECTNFKDVLIEYNCLCYNKNYEQKFDEKLKEWFLNTYKFSNHDNNVFVLLFQKGAWYFDHVPLWSHIKFFIPLSQTTNSHQHGKIANSWLTMRGFQS